MRYRPLWLSPSFPLILAIGCRGPSPREVAPSGLGSDPEGCRSFATLGGVDVGRTTGERRCRFDAESGEHRCEVSLDGSLSSSVSEYASVADFIEAGHTLGKHTSLAETRVDNGQTRRLSYRYDELGRLVRSIDEAPGERLITAFSDYDELGRPRRATSQPGDADAGEAEQGCGGWLEDIEYSDTVGTVSHRSRRQNPERCGFAERTLVEHFDGAGNRVSAVAADAAGIGDSFVARHPTAIDRVCL
jgi:YD repeat-containing protein